MTTPAESATKIVAKPIAADTTAAEPLIIDMGKKSRKQVRRAREGTGKLMDKINLMLEDLRAEGTIKADAQPVLIIVRQKPRKKALGWPLKY